MDAGLCTEESYAACMADTGGGQNMAWACLNCPKAKPEDMHDYTQRIFSRWTLVRAGYPFEKNDMTTDEWMDIGEIDRWMERQKNTRSS